MAICLAKGVHDFIILVKIKELYISLLPRIFV